MKFPKCQESVIICNCSNLSCLSAFYFPLLVWTLKRLKNKTKTNTSVLCERNRQYNVKSLHGCTLTAVPHSSRRQRGSPWLACKANIDVSFFVSFIFVIVHVKNLKRKNTSLKNQWICWRTQLLEPCKMFWIALKTMENVFWMLSILSAVN